MRQIKGTQTRKINIKDNNRYYATKIDIANELAKTFSDISSSKSYLPNFQRLKKREEQPPIEFRPAEEENYNKDFTQVRLEMTLRRAKKYLTGPR